VTAAQKELVFYIVNKLMLERDVKFHLVVKEEEDEKTSQDRIKNLSRELNSAGIDPSRIVTEQVFPTEKTQRGVVELKLFR
jgi:type IV pilus biogenesis protein CpaD/CtpE